MDDTGRSVNSVVRTIGVWTVRTVFAVAFVYAGLAGKPDSTLLILGVGLFLSFCWIDEPEDLPRVEMDDELDKEREPESKP